MISLRSSHGVALLVVAAALAFFPARAAGQEGIDVAGMEVPGPGEAPLEDYRGTVDPTKCSVVLVWREE